MASHVAGVGIVQTRDGIELTVKVVPGASRTRVAGVWGTALKLAVSAPAEGGRANAAVIELLAGALGVGKRDVSIIRGRTGPLKTVVVAKLTADEARQRLAAL
jgi:hypothetical protein